MYYNERMAWIRDCKNITQKEIADFLGIKQQQYARYEKGINVMPITHLPKSTFIQSSKYVIVLIQKNKRNI